MYHYSCYYGEVEFMDSWTCNLSAMKHYNHWGLSSSRNIRPAAFIKTPFPSTLSPSLLPFHPPFSSPTQWVQHLSDRACPSCPTNPNVQLGLPSISLPIIASHHNRSFPINVCRLSLTTICLRSSLLRVYHSREHAQIFGRHLRTPFLTFHHQLANILASYTSKQMISL